MWNIRTPFAAESSPVSGAKSFLFGILKDCRKKKGSRDETL